MKKIPDIISSKDLLYIEDAFNWNFTIAKKALEYSYISDDKSIINHYKEVYKKHLEICNKLLDIIGG